MHGEHAQDVSLLLSDEVMEKLRLLDFEAKFCAAKDVVPFPRTYFALPAGNSRCGPSTVCSTHRTFAAAIQRRRGAVGDAMHWVCNLRWFRLVLTIPSLSLAPAVSLCLHSLQFQYFVDLFKFLMKLCRRDFTTDKFDDPNTMCVHTLLCALTALLGAAHRSYHPAPTAQTRLC
jgi:hypothetical protein